MLHTRRIDRSFAITTKEVTVEQFQRFLKENPGVEHDYTKRYSPVPEGPQTTVTWDEAASPDEIANAFTDATGLALASAKRTIEFTVVENR